MRLRAVAGVSRVSLASVERTTDELVQAMARIRGGDSARDPGLAVPAREAAELAHSYRAGLLATVEHPAADPAILVAGVVSVDRPLDPGAAAEMGYHLADTGPDIREVTHAKTAQGYHVVIAERIPVADPNAAAQLQAVVIDPDRPRIAILTLHSRTGRGWLELAGIAGRLVATMEWD